MWHRRTTICTALTALWFVTPFLHPATGAVTAGPAASTNSLSYSVDPSGNQFELNFDIREDIKNAREFLRQRRSGYTVRTEQTVVPVKDRRGRTKNRTIRRRVIEPAFLLAVEDVRERRIRQVRYTTRGCETDGFDVVMTRNNGVGSRFEVRYPKNMAVLALRTMVHNERKGYEEVVYTPYGPEIDTPQIRQDGLNYLRGQIESARTGLEAANVRLKGFEALPDVFSLTDISLVLSIIEHIDPLRYKNCPPGGETALVNEVLTVIGANRARAYAYSRSPAGARGLFQFIPGTYEKILRKYPGARLEKNFVAGCTNHVNAAKASLLLFDSDLNDLPGDYLRVISRDVQGVGRYLAAAYNCGSKRVERSLKSCAEVWTCILPEETRTYVRKFDSVWGMRMLLDM
jgi:hypothetical protein